MSKGKLSRLGLVVLGLSCWILAPLAVNAQQKPPPEEKPPPQEQQTEPQSEPTDENKPEEQKQQLEDQQKAPPTEDLKPAETDQAADDQTAVGDQPAAISDPQTSPAKLEETEPQETAIEQLPKTDQVAESEPLEGDDKEIMQPLEVTASALRYQMDVSLDEEKKVISGHSAITFENLTTRPIPTLQFHLYYNAFRDSSSTFLRERPASVSHFEKDEDWGSVEIDRMVDTATQMDLLADSRFISDDGNADDRTVLEVNLPEAMAPGETIAIDLNFRSKMPKSISRTGWSDDYFMAVQWFPKLGVWTAEEGWNTHNYHAMTEYFAPFASFDVTIRLATDLVIGATGKQQEKRENADGTVSHRFAQDNVHDFAWVASRNFIRVERQFQEAGLPTTTMILLLQKAHDTRLSRFLSNNLKERYLTATSHGLKGFGEWVGPYPYETITIVDPMPGSRTGGMEYPTLFTGGTNWWAPPQYRSPEGVTIHEFGHQYFFGFLASNEFEESFMDEGFNSYWEGQVSERAFGPNVIMDRFWGIPVTYPLEIKEKFSNISGWRYAAEADPISQISYKYYNRTSYGANSYGRTAATLGTLRNILGKERFVEIFQEYYRRYLYRHPKLIDFQNLVAEMTDSDMTWFFDELFHKAGNLDYGVAAVDVEEWSLKGPQIENIDSDIAVVDDLMVDDGQQEATADDPMVQTDPPPNTPAEVDGPKTYRNEVRVRRYGDARVPVDILIEFSDDSSIQESWDGAGRWWKKIYWEPRQIKRVVVDPDWIYETDVNRVNNSFIVESVDGRRTAWYWAIRYLFTLQNQLRAYSFFQ